MSGTRALFASIGASVLLVAAAALSLLAVSAVFAFGGWSAPIAQSEPQTALILADDGSGSSAAVAKPLVLAARDRPRSTRSVARPSAPAQSRSRAGEALLQSATRPRPKASYPAPAVSAPDPQTAPPAPAAAKPSPGDGVRSAGEGLGNTVQSTGDALAQVTDPLLPPVTAATQKVLDGVAELLRRSTDGVGGTVDGLVARR